MATIKEQGTDFYKNVKGLIFESIETENDCIANMDRVIQWEAERYSSGVQGRKLNSSVFILY